jgi:hypothetical protein
MSDLRLTVLMGELQELRCGRKLLDAYDTLRCLFGINCEYVGE